MHIVKVTLRVLSKTAEKNFIYIQYRVAVSIDIYCNDRFKVFI